MLWLAVRILTGISNFLSGRRTDKWGEARFGEELHRAWQRELDWANCHGLNHDEVPCFVRYAVVCKSLREQGYDTGALETLPYHQGIDKTIRYLAGYVPEETRAERAGLPDWAYYRGIESAIAPRMGKQEAKKVRERAQVMGDMDGVAWWSLDEILSRCAPDTRQPLSGPQRR